MNKKKWQALIAAIVIPAIVLLYYNQSANWHYHITENGIVVEHAHPFSNSMIPGTPYQDHEHSDFEYLVLAQLMHTLGLAAIVLLLLASVLLRQRKNTPLPVPVVTGPDPMGPNPTRGPPCFPC